MNRIKHKCNGRSCESDILFQLKEKLAPMDIKHIIPERERSVLHVWKYDRNVYLSKVSKMGMAHQGGEREGGGGVAGDR